jgi:tRNA-Thr(GGU) m(6)t(6)A37 methyltransferase TsaA
MTDSISYVLEPVGFIHSELKNRSEAPRQNYEGAPDAWVELDAKYLSALDGILTGEDIILISWLHKSRREVLKVHPRGRTDLPEMGVFATRSPDRPNPIGLHRVKVLEIRENRIKVAPLEAIDGTPVVDIKPILANSDDR